MPDCVDVLQGFPQTQVRIGGRMFGPGNDRGVAVLLTVVSWVIQQLPHKVVEHQRAELVKTLAQARNLAVEVRITPEVAVRVRDGQQLLVELPADPMAPRGCPPRR